MYISANELWKSGIILWKSYMDSCLSQIIPTREILFTVHIAKFLG